MKNLDENSFEGYKAKFSERSAGLFAKCDDKQKYVDGFNSVNTYKDLDAYTEKINKEYNEVKQNYLLERNYVKSANALINRADAINNTASAAKKTADLESFQSDLKSFGKSASLQNFFIILTYILGIGALALMVFFLLTNMIANFKTSYKIVSHQGRHDRLRLQDGERCRGHGLCMFVRCNIGYYCILDYERC